MTETAGNFQLDALARANWITGEITGELAPNPWRAQATAGDTLHPPGKNYDRKTTFVPPIAGRSDEKR